MVLRQLNRIFLVSLFAIALLAPYLFSSSRNSIAEEKGGVTSFPELSEPQLDLFLGGLFDQKSVVVFPSPDAPPPEGLLFEFWRPYPPEVSTAVDLLLRFHDAMHPMMAPIKPVTEVDIGITFKREGITVRHSFPKDDSLIGGVSVRFSDKPRIVTLEGYNDSSIRFVTSSMLQGWETPGLLLCFVRISEMPLDGEVDAPKSSAGRQYRLAQAGFGVDARATGEFESGLEPGRARATVLTSGNIRNTTRYSDEVAGRKPFVEVRTKTEAATSLYTPARPDSLSEGVVAETDLRSSSGLRRLVRQRDVVRVRRLELELASLERLGLLLPPSESSIVEANGCFVILREYVRNTSYLKEEPAVSQPKPPS